MHSSAFIIIGFYSTGAAKSGLLMEYPLSSFMCTYQIVDT